MIRTVNGTISKSVEIYIDKTLQLTKISVEVCVDTLSF